MLPKPLHPGMSVMLRKFFSTFCVLTKSEISRGRSLVQGALTRGPETPQSFLERLQVLTRRQGPFPLQPLQVVCFNFFEKSVLHFNLHFLNQ